MTVSANGQVRTRHRAVLPAKIEQAYRESEHKRGVNKTSRLDYAAGYEDGYQQALDDMAGAMQVTRKALRRELLAP
jgi:hypothetical protein